MILRFNEFVHFPSYKSDLQLGRYECTSVFQTLDIRSHPRYTSHKEGIYDNKNWCTLVELCSDLMWEDVDQNRRHDCWQYKDLAVVPPFTRTHHHKVAAAVDARTPKIVNQTNPLSINKGLNLRIISGNDSKINSFVIQLLSLRTLARLEA